MPKILLGMFSPAISDKISFGLYNRGYNCLVASDPLSLKDLVQHNEVSLLIIEINHNENILKSFIKALKNTKKYQQIPILVVINKSSVAEIDEMFRIGADDCMSKPFKLASLLAKAETILNEGVPKTDIDNNPIPEVIQKSIEKIKEEGRLLGDVSEIFIGASVSDPKARRLSSPGSEWTPIIVNEAVAPFYVGKEREYILIRKHLIRHTPKESEYAVEEKILLKRTLNPFAAAVDTSQEIFSSELYAIQTAKGLSCPSLACILNSRYANFYFQRCRLPAEGLRSIYLTKSDIQQLPIIIPKPKQQNKLEEFYTELAKITKKNKDSKDTMKQTKTLKKMNSYIFKIFNINDEAIAAFNSLHF